MGKHSKKSSLLPEIRLKKLKLPELNLKKGRVKPTFKSFSIKNLKFDRRIIIPAALVLLFLLGLSIYKFADRALQRRASEKIMEQAHRAVTYAEEKPAATTTETASEKPEKEYDEICPISVDFEYLLGINEDVKAWLYCPDTQINFEIMQGPDNDYYLYRLMNREKNKFGTTFIDFRNAPDFSDANTLIYGHDMQNGSMFGELELYKSQDYYNRHPVMYLLTPEQNYRLEIICGFLHTAESNMYNVPSTSEEVDWYMYDAITVSTFQSKFYPQEGDRFTTLTTCADDYEGARYALICRMVEIG